MSLRKKEENECNDCVLGQVCRIYSKYSCIHKKNKKGKSFCIPIEMFLGVTSTLFGIVLLFPFETFKNNEIYTAMYHVAHEEIWGILCVLIGFFQILVTLKTKKRHWRVASLACQTFLWSFVGTMFLINDLVLGHSLNVASSTYLCLAGLSLYTAYKL